jgi:short-subunit dehydrogenase
MALRLKRIAEQVIVITGASSGIGLVTARRAARRGARVVLAARNEPALARAVENIRAMGGQAVYAVADVSDERDVERIADVALEEFGGFDSWVNNASVGIFGTTLQVATEDIRRLFEVNFFGVVHGSRVAAEHFRERFGDGWRDGGYAGAIVNVGSTASDRVVPLLGVYGAAKHAMKAFTDALRMDLEHERAPVSVSLVKPAAIDTPFYDNARNYLAFEARPTPPVYAPEVAAEAILACAERPLRDVFAGGGARALSAFGYHAPALADRAMMAMYRTQQTRRATHDGDGNLYRPLDGGERGRYRGTVLERSAYTAATTHPAVAAAVGIGAVLAVGARLLRARRTEAGRGGAAPSPSLRMRAAPRLGDAPAALDRYAAGPADLPVARGLAREAEPAPGDGPPRVEPVTDSAESAQHAPGGDGGGRVTPRTDVDVEL